MKTTPIPSQEQVTQAHLGAVLSAFATLVPYALHLKELPEGDGGATDGGARMAIEQSIVKLCDRLDSIIDDSRRFSLDTQKSLEAQLSEVYTRHASVLKEQAESMRKLNAPHSRHSPALMKMLDGSWVAILGSLENLDNAIVGVGPCPAHALEAFDAAFNGEDLPAHLKQWVAERETALSQNLTPPAEPKTYEQNQQVDPGAGGTAPKNEGPKTRPRRNRKSTRKKPNCNRPKGGPSPEGDAHI